VFSEEDEPYLIQLTMETHTGFIDRDYIKHCDINNINNSNISRSDMIYERFNNRSLFNRFHSNNEGIYEA